MIPGTQARGAAMFDDDLPKKPKGRVLGADLSAFSLQDLRDYIADLEAEIVRVREDLARKQTALGGADSIFGAKRS